MLACSLGKESKGLMDSEEWKFLLNFANMEEEAKEEESSTDQEYGKFPGGAQL